MKLDPHVHTVFSGYPSVRPLDRIMRESYHSVEAVFDALHAGDVRPGGREGHYLTMASDICALIGLPLIAVPLTLALGHFVLEGRFNRGLLLDLVTNRGLGGLPEVA